MKRKSQRKRLIQMYKKFGLDKKQAGRVADYLIEINHSLVKVIYSQNENPRSTH